jgi:hypothetical protein
LDASHFGNGLRGPVFLERDVAQPDRSDQPLVAHGHHGGHLFVEWDPGCGMATKIHYGHLVQPQRLEVGQYSFPQLLRALGLVYAA